MKAKIRLNLRQIRIFIISLTFLVVAGEIGYWIGNHGLKVKLTGQRGVKIEQALPEDKSRIDFSLFWEVWDKLSATYLTKSALDPQRMVWGAIRGMVASVGDPYTVFLPPDDNRQAKEDLNGAFDGVGIQLGYKGGALVVIAPLEGTPAEKAGVRAGDLILEIDDQETTDISLPEAVKLIRGQRGTKVKLSLLHEGGKEPIEVDIIRETIVVPSVTVKFLEGEIAHLKLTRFGERTNQEWAEAVDQIVSHNPLTKGIILDLRNNPGGFLSGSVFIASEFLAAAPGGDEASSIVVQQENADGTKETFSVNRPGKITSQPLVVLVNEGSASASEIVAGALQDHKRAKLVGEKTFGKGTIQEAYDLQAGSGLHVTTARWLLPSGKSIDKGGVTPDVEVKDESETEEDEQLQKAIEVLESIIEKKTSYFAPQNPDVTSG